MRKEAHFGCAMMEEQATVIGARLSLESRPGAGTVGHTRRPARRVSRAGWLWRRHGWGDAGRIRILIVDDHEVVRRGLEGILSACDDLEVVGQASSGEEAVCAGGDPGV